MSISFFWKLRIILPFALGYFLSYLFRVINAVLAPDLAADIGVDPAELGLLTGSYFITFAAFQLPLGVLLDRYGPRRVEAVLLVFAAVGALIFSYSTTMTGLVIGRGLIGLGVSACLMAALKAYVIWFPGQQLPRINGFHLSAGGLGALAATTPVEAVLTLTDWRGVFLILSVFALAVSAAIFFIIPEKKSESLESGLKEQIYGIRTVFKSAFFWRITPLAITSQSTFLSIQSLWAGPWLRDIAVFDRTGVARMLLLIFAAMIVGYSGVGALAVRLNRIGIQPLTVAIFGMGLFVLNFLLIVLQFETLTTLLWISFGFLGTCGILVYAVLPLHFPSHLAGRVITGFNLMIFIFSFINQWGIGAVINLWPATAAGGYAPQGYRFAFGMLLIFQLLAFAWYWLSGKVFKKDKL